MKILPSNRVFGFCAGTLFGLLVRSALLWFFRLKRIQRRRIQNALISNAQNREEAAASMKDSDEDDDSDEEDTNLHRDLSVGRLAALTAPSAQSPKYVLVMVGLPARGKSYIVRMIMRYLKWTGIEARLFNVGAYRRQMGLASVSASFFDPTNQEAKMQRERLAQLALDDMYSWLSDQPGVAVSFFDATNTTIERRGALIERNRRENGVSLVFVESICTDPGILERNYAMKLNNDDYKGRDAAQAKADFMERVKQYEQVYQTIQDSEDGGRISFIKVYNVGEKVTTRRCEGYIPSQVAFFLMNIHISPRRIWLSRHAESIDTVRGVLGTDRGELSRNGELYAYKLAEFIKQRLDEMKVLKSLHMTDKECDCDNLIVLLGTQQVHQATAKYLSDIPGVFCVYTSLLNELRGGEFEGMTHEEIQNKFPKVWKDRVADKLHYRYPGAGGESYIDVIQRVKPIIIELERQRKSVLVISHLAVQRCLFGYFNGGELEALPHYDLPIHHVTELEMAPHGSHTSTHKLAESDPSVALVNLISESEKSGSFGVKARSRNER